MVAAFRNVPIFMALKRHGTSKGLAVLNRGVLKLLCMGIRVIRYGGKKDLDNIVTLCRLGGYSQSWLC